MTSASVAKEIAGHYGYSRDATVGDVRSTNHIDATRIKVINCIVGSRVHLRWLDNDETHPQVLGRELEGPQVLLTG